MPFTMPPRAWLPRRSTPYRPLSLFPHAYAADAFDAAHSAGPFKLLPRTTGDYALHDTRAPLGYGIVAIYPTLALAHAALTHAALHMPYDRPRGVTMRAHWSDT